MKKIVLSIAISLLGLFDLFGQIEFRFDKAYYHSYDTINITIRNPSKLVFGRCRSQVFYSVEKAANYDSNFEPSFQCCNCQLDLPPQYLNDSIIKIKVFNSFQNTPGEYRIVLKNVPSESLPSNRPKELDVNSQPLNTYQSESIFVLPKLALTPSKAIKPTKEKLYYYENSILKEGILYKNYSVVGRSSKNKRFEIFSDYYGLKAYENHVVKSNTPISEVANEYFDSDLQRIVYINPTIYKEVESKLSVYGQFCINDKGSQTALTNRIYLKLKANQEFTQIDFEKLEALNLVFENKDNLGDYDKRPFYESYITVEDSLERMQEIAQTFINLGYFQDVSYVFNQALYKQPYNNK